MQLLIIDDFLLTPPTDWECCDLPEIVEDHYQSGATVITSHCPIGGPMLADAICDRLFHNAYKIELKGDSMRKKQGRLTTSIAKIQKKRQRGRVADEIGLK